MTGIYAIHNKINNKYYIGQTIDINQRWMQHRSRLKTGVHENKHLQSAYNLYGKDAFEYILIEECNKSELDEKEMYYIEKYNSYNNGYNSDKGGAGCKGYKHTEEEIIKMRQIQNPKSVLQLDMELNVVNEWMSCSHAGKTLGFAIRGIKACCNRINRQKTIGGYYWVYKEEYENGTVDWDYYLNINLYGKRKISRYDLNGNLIEKYESVAEAARQTGFSRTSIDTCLSGKRKSSHNSIWKYDD